ncbi:MAG: Eco57I restriction-modification methylase domain-containing protein [Deltaproteobacteria bacterium]|nr:Eco57I restriction-modification methylase domain-containing protein [Deltaproteobacteria bacterium]
MVGLFGHTTGGICRLLDAGAGIGSLTAAFLERWASGGFDFLRVEADAFEVDESLHPHLNQTLEEYKQHLNIESTVRGGDFIAIAADSIYGNLFAKPLPRYTHAILNPPYKKIRSNSTHRAALSRVGIETVNLYSAFVALSLALLGDCGQLVAIIPRSFCNGPYYRPFREFMLTRSAIRHLHLFDSRTRTFKDDGVLQENIIIMLERGGHQGDVTVSTSTDDSFADLVTHTHPFDRIVLPDDPERFIHVPTSMEMNAIELLKAVQYSLTDIGIMVSTGPVVDFRLKAHLRDMPEPGTVPLLYPGHFSGQGVEWPKTGTKKPNAILRNADTEKWLYPAGCYCVVRRFSSKEENRRIVASVVHPSDFGGAEMLGFENHLNVFHIDKRGLPEAFAHGLAVFLDTTAVDENFRRFNGHTQVNATDLKLMKYPSRKALITLGEWAMRCGELTQAMIDKKLEGLAA